MNAKSFYVAVAVRRTRVQQVRKALQGHKGQEAAQALWDTQGILVLRVTWVARVYPAHPVRKGLRVSPAKTEPLARQAPWVQQAQKEELDQLVHKGFKVGPV